MKKKTIAWLLCLTTVLALTGCATLENLAGKNDPALKQWSLIEESAKGSAVTLYAPTLTEQEREWYEEVFKPYLKTQYDVTLTVETLEFPRIYEQLKQEKVSETLTGTIDLVALPEGGFKKGADSELWYGPFVNDMPLVLDTVDAGSLAFNYVDGIRTNAYALPYAFDQLVMIYDRDVFYDAPTTWPMLFDLIKSYKGTFTYPDPRKSKVGEAFVLSYLLSDVHLEDYMTVPQTKADLKATFGPALETLRDIEPHLYDAGETYPVSATALDKLFFEGDVLFSMSLNYNHATEKLSDYEYPEGAYSFIFDDGTFGYGRYMAVAHNAPNKSGAMVVLNALLSGEMQASRFNPKNLGTLPVVSPLASDTSAFDAVKGVKTKSTTPKVETLIGQRLSEIPAANRKIMIDLWEEVVFNNGNAQ